MRFQTPLIPARLIRRYKRFLADMQLPDGREVTAHCANPGSMLGMREPGLGCWLEPNDDPKKKLRYSWKLAEVCGGMAVIDTSLANKVVGEALRARAVAGLEGYEAVRAEVPYGKASRVDFLLSGGGLPDALVEVKSVTLAREGWAEFPDSVTARGAKHLAELAEAARGGRRAVILYLVSRSDCARVRLAGDIDPAYAAAHMAAKAAGVETLCLSSVITTEAITPGPMLSFGEAE